jgi:hypothetical protein
MEKGPAAPTTWKAAFEQAQGGVALREAEILRLTDGERAHLPFGMWAGDNALLQQVADAESAARTEPERRASEILYARLMGEVPQIAMPR